MTGQRVPALPDCSAQPTLVEQIRSCRFLPIDTYPRVVHLAQQPIGSAILLALFALLLPIQLKWAVAITIAAGITPVRMALRMICMLLSTMVTPP